MKCNSCGKEINLKKEWAKRSFFNKVSAIFLAWTNDSYFGDLSFLSKGKSLAMGMLRAVMYTILLVAHILTMLRGLLMILSPVPNLLDKYVFLKPLFNTSVPVITFSNTAVPFFEGVGLLLISFCILYIMFKNNLEENLRNLNGYKIVFLGKTFEFKIPIKCPHCGKINEEISIEEPVEKPTKKQQKNNIILGISIIVIAIVAFVVFLFMGNNWHMFLDNLWLLISIFVVLALMILWTRYKSKINLKL
jgi:phage FluMu protein Com